MQMFPGKADAVGEAFAHLFGQLGRNGELYLVVDVGTVIET